MSEIYSSTSGSYSSYLSQRQTDEIKQQIQKSANQQTFATAMTGYYLGTKIDSVNQNIVRMSTGIQNSINQNTYTIAASAEMLRETFDAGFDAINNKLDMGFAGVTEAIGTMSASMTAGFNSVVAAIDFWGEKICEKLDAIHDIVNNPLLTASRELYRRATKNSEKKFYEEALEDIKGAIEKNKTDYISWGLMGKLYLFGMSEFSNVVDVPKALEAFTNACKYISPDIDESEEARKMAAEFYFYLGYANYILSNESRLENKTDDVVKYLQESVKANERSFKLSDTMLEAAYNLVRSLTLLDQREKALSILETVIRTDGLYSIRALGDEDLKRIDGDIQLLIKRLRDEYKSQLKNILSEFSVSYEYIGGKYCDYIKQLVNKGNALTSSDCQYLDIRSVFERFDYEYSKIKRLEHPLDILVYKNKIVDCEYENPLKKHFSVEIDPNSSYMYDEELLTIYSRKSFNNQIAIGEELCRTHAQDMISPGEKIPDSQLQLVVLRFQQNNYGEKGEIIVTDINKASAPKWFYDKDCDIIYCTDYEWILNEYTTLRLKDKQLEVLQRGIVAKDFIKKAEQEKQRKIEAETKEKEHQKIKAQQRASERLYEEKIAKKNRIIYIIGIILFVPLVILGRFLLHKSGMFIFGFLDIAFISFYVAKSIFGAIGGSIYSPQKFLLGWELYQKKNFALHISMTLALSILGAKLGSFIRHGFLGFLAGLILYIILVIILCSKSKRYR